MNRVHLSLVRTLPTVVSGMVLGLVLAFSPAPVHAQTHCSTSADCPSGQQCVSEQTPAGISTVCATPAAAGMSCDQFHSCATGYACNANNVCQAVSSSGPTTPQGQNGSSGQGGSFPNPLGVGTSLSALLMDILNLVMRLGTVAIILMLVVVGFMYVTARGNPGAITKAHNALMWTVVGALVLLGSAALAQGICATVVALGGGSGSCPSLL